MRIIKLFILFFFVVRLITASDFVDYVNPLMGSQSEFKLSTGNTYPVIGMPWGMNCWTPQTNKMGDGWVYNYNHYQINGFKQTHQPSPWINDYGQFSIMPVTGNKITEKQRESWFSHKSELAKPHYYSVYLADHDIFTEIAPTERAAIFRMTFPENDSSRIVIDAFDKGSFVKVIPSENKIIGYTTRNSGGVPDNFRNYFVIIFDQPFAEYRVWTGNKIIAAKEVADNHVGAVIDFKTRKSQKVHLRVASSFISYEQAELNLKELGDKSFDTIKEQGRKRWNEVLSKIDIEADLDVKRTFYSCLYRSTLFPRKFYEINSAGEIVHYSPYNGEIRSGYMYTDTGFWDTFRALFPLLNLVYPDENIKIQQGLMNTYLESGFMPEWASPGHRDCMVGNNSASVIADAILKNITPDSLHLSLYEAMIKTANDVHPEVSSTGRLGYEYYNTLGYVPYNVGIKENAARTLEYAYNDWCIYQVAKKLNRPAEETELYRTRSKNYSNLFDKSSGLMRGRNKEGDFQAPFNPLKWGDAFTEGNSWHYTWSVFHDIEGLKKLMGGREKFVSMLDSVFAVPPVFDNSYYGFTIHEIREMQIMNMGNYAHGNQPIQHMIYLYNYGGEPWKTQYWVRETMNRMYRPTPDGYCGDEDNGQTSAWYVFSALGFYPVCPGTDQYVIGSPLVNKATIKLSNGKKINITATGNNATNRYIQSMTVNGRKNQANYLDYNQLKRGANINFKMDSIPNKKRGILEKDVPYSMSMLK